MKPSEPHSSELWVCALGTVAYREASAMQEELRERRLTGETPDVLLLLEHPPVYTRGRRSRPGELALGEDFYRAKGIEVVDTRRGGRVTYHGPGQLVGYAIVEVRDVGEHLRRMEAAIVETLAELGIAARSRCEEGPDYTGVWVEDRKIASIGVHVSRGVSTHGFAINVDNDLEPFSWVVACGLPDVAMTSVEAELRAGRASEPADMLIDSGVLHARVRARAGTRFCEVHDRRPRLVDPEELGIVVGLGGREAAEPREPSEPARGDVSAPERDREVLV
jgi:lipoyl(octanoyl) transferase